MKYILPLLLVVVSLQACGQSKDVIAHNSSGTVREVNGTSIPDNSCDPKIDVDKARDRAIGLTMINGGYDHTIRYCDPKSRQWTVDTEAMKAADAQAVKAEAERVKRIAHNKALIFAMNSRVVTDKEMAEVTELGTGIFSECCAVITGGGFSGSSESWQMQQYASSYYEEKRFNDLLLQQFKLRATAAEHKARGFGEVDAECAPGVRNITGIHCVPPHASDRACLAINTPDARACMGLLPADPEPMGSYYCGSHDCTIPFPMPITGCPVGLHPVQTGTDQFECRSGSVTAP